jgi:transcription initiation factor TFIID subunit TAF12
MSQPVLQKTPGYNLEGDGDRVLSKKKLDELVRQVTGGGEGLGGGESLTPEVEEVCVFAPCLSESGTSISDAKTRTWSSTNMFTVHPHRC